MTAPRATPRNAGILQRAFRAIDRAVSTAVLLREAARTSRRWQTFAARTAFSGTLMAVLLLGIHGAVTATSSTLVDAADLAWLGRALFTAFAVAQLALATFLAPLSTASAVIEEAEEGTLDLLVLTRLSVGQILAGKILSRLMVLATVVLGGLPLATLMIALGGVSGLEIVAATVHALTTVLVMGLLGAFFALFTRSPMLCVMASAAYALPFFLVLPGAYAAAVADLSALGHFSPFGAAQAQGPDAWLTPLAYLPSLWVIWRLLQDLFVLKTAGAGLSHAFSHDVWQTWHWAVALGLWLLAAVGLGPALPYLWASAASPMTFPGADVLWWLARGFLWAWTSVGFALGTWAYLRVAFDVVDGLDGIFHPRRDEGAPAGPVDVGTNPIWWREARFRAWVRTAAPALSTWMLVLLAVLQTGWWLVPGGILLLGVANAAFALALAAWMGARAFADERRRATLEPLLTTTLADHRIVVAKTAGVAFATLPLVLATLPLLVLGVPHVRLWDLIDHQPFDLARSLAAAVLTWCWLVAVWGATVTGSLTAGLRLRTPRSAFGLVVGGITVALLVPAALGRLFPEVVWLAWPARLWAPPLAGGASLPVHVVSTIAWGLATVGLFAALSLRLRRWALVAFALVAVGLAMPGMASAQGIDVAKEMERLNQLRMTAEPLADGLHRRDGWAAVAVTLENTGAATEGTLTLSEQGTDGTRTWQRRIELSEGARKEVVFVFQATGRTPDRTLAFLTGEGRSAVARFQMQPRGADDVLVGVIGRDPLGLPAAVRDTTAEGVPSRRPRPWTEEARTVRTGLVAPLQLPRHAMALSGLDWLVWPDADPSALEAAQARALEAWVADGGHLLLTVSDGARQVQDSALAPLIHGRLGPPRDATLGPLLARLGHPDDPTPTPVAAFVPDADVWVGATTDDGRPAWGLWRHGAGTVTLVTASLRLDPLEDVERARLWRTLLWLPESARPSAVPDELQPLLHAGAAPHDGDLDPFDDLGGYAGWEIRLRDRLDDIPGVSPLPLSWLVVFSGLYLLVIGPLDYFVLRALKRQPLTWVTFPVAIAVFTGIAIAGTRYTKGSTAILTRVERIDVLPDAGRWQGDTFFGIFSTRKVDLTVTSGFDDAVIAPLEEPGFLPDPTLSAGLGPGRMAWRAETWTLAYGRSSWTQPREDGVVAVDGGLRNDLPFDLEAVWLLRDEGGGPELARVSVGAAFEVGAVVPFAPDGLHWEPVDAASVDEAVRPHLAPPLSERGAFPLRPGELALVGKATAAVEPLVLDGLAPIEKPLVVVRQRLTGSSMGEVPHVRVTLAPPLDLAHRATLACGASRDALTPVEATLLVPVRPGPCELTLVAYDNTWFAPLDPSKGPQHCAADDVGLVACTEEPP